MEKLQKKLMYDAILYDLRNQVVSLLEGERCFDTAMTLGRCRKDRCRASALHLATSMGNIAITKILLDHGALLTVEGRWCWWSNHTPVHCAIRRDDEQTVRLFIDSGFPVDTEDTRGQTWLHLAAAMVKPKVVDLILQHGASVDALTTDQETPLHLLFRTCKLEDIGDGEVCQIVCALLHRRANVNIRSKQGQTPLHAAVEAGKIGAVRQLLAHGADVSTNFHSGNTSLHFAATSDIVEALLEAGADVNAKDEEGNTCLHFLFTVNHQPIQPSDIEKTFDLLMRYGANINARNEAGSSVLHRALWAESPLVTKILSSGADPNAVEYAGPSPLGIAARNDLQTAFEELLNRGADIHWKDARGWTLFHYASSDLYFVRRPEPYKQLLERGLSPDTPDNNGDTPLLLAVKRGNLESVTFLLNVGADANANDKEGLTRLQHLSVRSYQSGTTIVKELIMHGADINLKDASGDTVLHRALKSINGKATVKALIASGADPNATDAKGHTPLQLAIWKGWDDEVVRGNFEGWSGPECPTR